MATNTPPPASENPDAPNEGGSDGDENEPHILSIPYTVLKRMIIVEEPQKESHIDPAYGVGVPTRTKQLTPSKAKPDTNPITTAAETYVAKGTQLHITITQTPYRPKRKRTETTQPNFHHGMPLDEVHGGSTGSKAATFVTNVQKNSPAERAGLQTGH